MAFDSSVRHNAPVWLMVHGQVTSRNAKVVVRQNTEINWLFTEIRCAIVGPLSNGYIEGDDTSFGAIVVFRCLEKMTHIGPSYSRCEDDATWSHPLPKCFGKKFEFLNYLLPSITSTMCRAENRTRPRTALESIATRLSRRTHSNQMRCKTWTWNYRKSILSQWQLVTGATMCSRYLWHY
jgi:hypothetical protein